jgi:hypothetical protein
MTRAPTIAWVTLMALTVLAFLLAESHAMAAVILLVAGAKFGIVGWQFMDLRHAAWPWPVGIAVFLSIACGLILVLR